MKRKNSRKVVGKVAAYLVVPTIGGNSTSGKMRFVLFMIYHILNVHVLRLTLFMNAQEMMNPGGSGWLP